ncbi:hypothetical protein M0804_013848 [Polistes exclamans]|nr:hypothetical protein M0804_013848 [Polistes exclamans]
MSKEDSLDEVNKIAHYQKRALTMMQVYESEEKEEFYLWLNKFESVANIIKIPEDKMVELFNKMVDNNFHERIKNINPHVNFSELSYEQIINHYLCFFPPADETYLHRKRFFCRDQYKQETIDNYAYCLEKIHNNCYYTCYVDERLCDQFTNGILDDDIKKYLNKIPYLSFDETVKKAIEFVKVNNYLRTALLMMNIYNPKKERLFYRWLNKFEYVADTIGVPDDIMIAFFNKMIGNNVHKAILQSYPHIDILKLSYEEKVSLYLNFFFQSNEIFIHRKRFKCRHQFRGETLQKFANSLRKIFYKCDYQTCFEERLCEQFMDGIYDDDLRNNLSKISKISFKTLLEKAINEFEKKKNIHNVNNRAYMNYEPLKYKQIKENNQT